MNALDAWLHPIAQADGYVILYRLRKFEKKKMALLKKLAVHLPENKQFLCELFYDH